MSSKMSEIINLQLGHYSNFIGAHRWNIQESQFCHEPLPNEMREINHHCTFRVGKTDHGVETYTPRLIAVDLQGSLANVKLDRTLHDNDDSTRVDSQLWDGMVEVCKEEQSKSKLPVSTAADVWPDCLTTKLHPNTTMTLPGHWHNDLVQPFDCYPAGIEAAQNAKFVRELEDRLHFFTEECDHLQGFQLLTDIQDGFGGVSNEICAHILHEQFPKKAIWFNAVIPPSTDVLQIDQQHYRILNSALTMIQTLEHSSIFIPISTSSIVWGRSSDKPRVFPHLLFDNKQIYHSSAIVAAAMETITLPCCLDTNPWHMWDMIVPHTSLGRKIASLSCCLPLPLVANSNLQDSLAGRCINDHFTSLLLDTAMDKNVTHWSQHTVLRGIPTHYPLVPPNTMPSPLSSFLNAHKRAVTNYQLIQKPLIIPKSFPKIFSPQLTSTGLLSTDNSAADVRNLPMGTTLQSSSSIHHCLTSLLTAVKSINIKRYPVFSSCLEHDGWTELQQSLHDLTDCYATLSAGDWSSDSD